MQRTAALTPAHKQAHLVMRHILQFIHAAHKFLEVTDTKLQRRCTIFTEKWWEGTRSNGKNSKERRTTFQNMLYKNVTYIKGIQDSVQWRTSENKVMNA
jgi:hypothetical protein